MQRKTIYQVISNNIANSETNGFKRSRAEFADLYATSQFGTSSNAIGQGVEVAAIYATIYRR